MQPSDTALLMQIAEDIGTLKAGMEDLAGKTDTVYRTIFIKNGQAPMVERVAVLEQEVEGLKLDKQEAGTNKRHWWAWGVAMFNGLVALFLGILRVFEK